MKLLKLLILAIVLTVTALFFGFSNNDEITGTSGTYTSGLMVTQGMYPDLAGAWTVGAVFPPPLTDLGHGQGYSRNDTGWFYVYGGEVSLNNLRIYNSRTNTWTSGAPMPVGLEAGSSARLLDTLYMIGGVDSLGLYKNSMLAYNIRTNIWSTKAPIPTNRGWSDGVGYQDSLVYVAGGYNGTSVVDTVYLYNAKTNTWRIATSLPAIRFGGGFAVSGDTLVYCGGVDGISVKNTTYRGVISQSDRSIITWTSGANTPVGMFMIDAHSWGCRGIIATGGSSTTSWGSVSNACYTYSPGANVWTTQPNKITAWTAGQSGSFALNNNIWKLVCASGFNGTTQINNTEIFTDTLCPAPPSAPQTTFCRGGLNIPIPDNNWARDSVNVILGNNCTILDVNVRIDTVLHTSDSDLSFYLNRGTISVNIINQVGGSGDNFIGTTLDDSAATPITSGTAPFTGSFKPSNPLTLLNGSFVSGFWRLSISDTSNGNTGSLKRWCIVLTYNCPTGGVQTIEVPNYYSLSQNYPNPFNPSTSIKFTIPEGNNVKLVVYDILGREAATLVNEYRNSGTYNVNFEASALSSGVYFYRLETGKFTETKRMLLVK